MTGTGTFRFYFGTHRSLKLPQDWERISGDDFYASQHGRANLPKPAPPPPDWAEDLLRISRAVYLADRRASRRHAADGWTRTIELSVDLIEPDRWASQQSDRLVALLSTLTGDMWQLHFRPGAPSPLPIQGRLLDDWRAETVALFSGGLDSTAYAAEALRCGGGPLLLLAYYDPKLLLVQNEIYESLSQLRPVHLRQLLRKAKGALEPSTRARGLLFLATAVSLAAAHEATTVIIPENGLLAVNPPLTPSRVAACSTRSAHPYTLETLNRIIEAAGGKIRVLNPLLGLTKGKVCRQALNAGLSPDVLARTVSCSRSPSNRSGASERHCGRCYPCMLRRAGLISALGKDCTRYLKDPWDPPKRGPDDLLALERWLSTSFTFRDLIADSPLPDGLAPGALLPVIKEGRKELIQMIDTLLPSDSPYRNGWRPIA